VSCWRFTLYRWFRPALATWALHRRAFCEPYVKLEVRPSGTSAFQKIYFNGQGKRQGHASGWRPPPYGEEVSFSLFGCVQNRTSLRWRQGAWAQRGLVPAWKGEVVGAPRCTRESVRLQDPVLPGPVSVLTLRNT
jgi:hypothetical protein